MGRLIIRSYQGGRSFTNAFSSNLNTLNLKIVPAMVEYSLEDEALTIL